MNGYHRLKSIFKKIGHLHYIQRIMMWDESVMMPEGSGYYRAQAMASLNQLTQEMLVKNNIQDLIAFAKNDDSLTAWDRANVAWMEKKHINSICIPSKLTSEWTKATLASQQAWRHLRDQNNWKVFSPLLEKTFKYVTEIAERKSQAFQLDPYDILIDEFSPGFNQRSIDPIFDKLKTSAPILKNKILKKQAEDSIIPLSGDFPVDKQKMLGDFLMSSLQFDYEHGRIDTSHHPFTDGIPVDIRITTRYNRSNFIESLMAVCHEAGHAMYEQGMPREWLFQPVGNIQCKATHESQALLFEYDVCHSRAFISYLAPKVQEIFGNSGAYSPNNLYKLINQVSTSLIRVNSDEVSYPLHVILRYELEKSLFRGEISISDLPARWNELMNLYLGVSPGSNHSDGVMQDVHWAIGYFGYFPSYALGQMISAQLFAAFTKAQPDFDSHLSRGDVAPLKGWLQENIYNSASSLSTNDLLLQVTGEALNADHFIQSVQKRYLA